MTDVFEVADALVTWATGAYHDEIDIIGYYGSYAQGTATDASDLDIFYIPADGKHPPISRTILIDGVLFDFWAISWQRMEEFATGSNRGWAVAPALVYHTQLLYARSEQQATRFAQLKQQVIDLQRPEARRQMIQRALAAFCQVPGYLGCLRMASATGDFADVRRAGWRVVVSAYECLALANQTFLDRGHASMLAALPKLQYKPANLEALIVTISASIDPTVITEAAEELAVETRRTLRDLQKSLPPKKQVSEVFANAYPEIKAMVDKVRSACKKRDSVTAHAAAGALQDEVALMLSSVRYGEGHLDFNLFSEFAEHYRELEFPELTPSTAGSLDALFQWASQLDERVRAWLRECSLCLHEFSTLDEFQRCLIPE